MILKVVTKGFLLLAVMVDCVFISVDKQQMTGLFYKLIILIPDAPVRQVDYYKNANIENVSCTHIKNENKDLYCNKIDLQNVEENITVL